jgi:hypothetical protein
MIPDRFQAEAKFIKKEKAITQTPRLSFMAEFDPDTHELLKQEVDPYMWDSFSK